MRYPFFGVELYTPSDVPLRIEAYGSREPTRMT